MARDRKRIVRLAVAAAVATAVLVVGFIALDRYLDPFDDRPFDPASWAAADEQQRGPMARDAARHVPHGTPAERVRELLGEPDHAVSDNPPDKWGRPVKGYTRWSYWLGCWSGLGWYGFDSADLDIYFNREGRVVVVEITGG
jgi:hypothetical protein